MIERIVDEAPSEVYIPTHEELVEQYLALSEEDKEVVIKRAMALRYGPTGMGEIEAIFAALAEFAGSGVED